MNKNDSKIFKNVTLTIAKMIQVVTKHFSTNSKIIENIRSLGKKDPAAKKSVLSIFSTDSWTNLEQLKKAKHSSTDSWMPQGSDIQECIIEITN